MSSDENGVYHTMKKWCIVESGMRKVSERRNKSWIAGRAKSVGD